MQLRDAQLDRAGVPTADGADPAQWGFGLGFRV